MENVWSGININFNVMMMRVGGGGVVKCVHERPLGLSADVCFSQQLRTSANGQLSDT